MHETGADLKIFDLHAHPVLKYFYLQDRIPENRGFDAIPLFNIPLRSFYPLSIRCSGQRLVKGRVGALASAVVVPEPRVRLFQRKTLSAWFQRLIISRLAPTATRGLSSETPYQLTLGMMNSVASRIASDRDPGSGKPRLALIKSMNELDLAVDRGLVAIYHAIEGGNCLYDAFPDPETLLFTLHEGDTWDVFRERLSTLRNLGLMQVTTSHYFDTHFVPQCENTQLPFKSSDDRAPMRYQGSCCLFHQAPFARLVVEACCQEGIAVDLVHASPEARWRAMETCKDHDRPVIVSHGCVRGPDDAFQPHPYALSDQELLKLHEMDGLLGLILSTCRHSYEHRGKKSDRGLPLLLETIKHVKKITGSTRILAIGSDFDGLSDPMDDCSDPSEFQDGLVEALESEPSLKYDDIEGICWNNAHRVMARAWRRAGASSFHSTTADHPSPGRASDIA